MAKNKKNILKGVEKYMKLPYTIELIPEEDGTYFVKVKELPGCMSAGDTVEEAIEMIHDAMRGWLEVAIEDGLEVPLPDVVKKYSGRFVVRVPKYLHRNLAEQAKKEGVSLNQFVVSLLSEKNALEKLLKKIEKLEEKIEALQNITVENKRPLKAVEEKLIWEELNGRKTYKIQ